ncbi:cytochrome C oxidase copper chaperone-domain-containing protein [Kockovaella imperatae]|uniref:Cytochrome C oxidase copper chaperone-domain-containing protein n=1 Tax=Kockovaella imperatae TaxID=4999 RepID=A0A1Y1UH53_9TREE|nr:cytochrome C oxidase copper chaperone-domain-containing protein [Kockovaella imperatae]ORX36415.1 cytochrome C oxidase copper chaperone-domain-containing protein [Kockovaella imperatae]
MGFLGFGSSSSTSSDLASRSASPEGAVTTSEPRSNPLNPNNVKPCCACPETKEQRDKCFFNNSPEEAGDKCRALVEAHRACMASYGFKV